MKADANRWIGWPGIQLLFLAFSTFPQVECGVFIYAVNPTRGSMYGGTQLVIRGSGFSSNTNALSNQIFIGRNYACDLIPLHSTVNQIICKTRPAIDINDYIYTDQVQSGVQPVTVIVDGNQISSCSPSSPGQTCSFEFMSLWYHTPRIESLSPRTVISGTMITISGFFHSAPFAFNEIKSPRLEVPLLSVKLANPSIAQQQPANEPFGQSGTRCMLFDPSSEQPYPIVQSGDTVSQFVCQIIGRDGGRYNMSVALLGQGMMPDYLMNMGESQVVRELYSYDHHGKAFMLQLAAVITGFYPNATGLLGGARLTVFGTGFSADVSVVRVEVGGGPCPIVSASGPPPPRSSSASSRRTGASDAHRRQLFAIRSRVRGPKQRGGFPIARFLTPLSHLVAFPCRPGP